MCDTIDNKNCIEKYETINERLKKFISDPIIFVIPYHNEHEYNDFGNILNKISYCKKFNFLQQGSN